MKKGVRFLGTGVLRLSLILLTAAGMLCLMPVCAALADGDFSSVDGIPQARDFDVRVDLDMGVPRIVTNYPFDETGATERIELVEWYSKKKAEEMGMTLEEYGKYTFEHCSRGHFNNEEDTI